MIEARVLPDEKLTQLIVAYERAGWIFSQSDPRDGLSFQVISPEGGFFKSMGFDYYDEEIPFDMLTEERQAEQLRAERFIELHTDRLRRELVVALGL